MTKTKFIKIVLFRWMTIGGAELNLGQGTCFSVKVSTRFMCKNSAYA